MAAGNNRVTNECRACHRRLEFLIREGVDPNLRRCANFLVATALMLVSGHDFSRAVQAQEKTGL
jgi:hypothetical protein